MLPLCSPVSPLLVGCHFEGTMQARWFYVIIAHVATWFFTFYCVPANSYKKKTIGDHQCMYFLKINALKIANRHLLGVPHWRDSKFAIMGEGDSHGVKNQQLFCCWSVQFLGHLTEIGDCQNKIFSCASCQNKKESKRMGWTPNHQLPILSTNKNDGSGMMVDPYARLQHMNDLKQLAYIWFGCGRPFIWVWGVNQCTMTSFVAKV